MGEYNYMGTPLLIQEMEVYLLFKISFEYSIVFLALSCCIKIIKVFK